MANKECAECDKIADAMQDGCHNPESMYEWKESRGHFPGCPNDASNSQSPAIISRTEWNCDKCPVKDNRIAEEDARNTMLMTTLAEYRHTMEQQRDGHKKEIARLNGDVKRLHILNRVAAGLIAELEAVVEKLPKTADEVGVVPGVDFVWADDLDGGFCRLPILGLGAVNASGAPEQISIESCYSTLAAAEAAQKEGDGNDQ